MRSIFGRRNKDAAKEAARLAAAAPSRPSFREMGGTGLKISGGQIMEEYNPDLQGPKLYSEFDKMLRGDGQVQGIELVVSLPVEALSYPIAPASSDPIDIQIAAEFEDNINEGMTCTFGSVVREAISAAFIGVNFLEKVWEVRDGATRLQKLAPRHPRTIKEWVFDPSGGMQGIVQCITDPTTRQTEDRPIPIGSLLRFTYRELSGDPTGRPLLRPMRTHWSIKHALYKIANIGMERFSIPSLWGQLPQGYTASDKSEYLALLESVRVAARGAGVLPPGYEIPKLVEGGQRLPDLLRWCEYHDQLMSRSTLSQFLNLGSGSTGSFALSDSHVELFLLALDQIAGWICEIINRYLIPQWVGYNYPTATAYPKMGHTPVARLMQKTALLKALLEVVSGGLIQSGPEIEDQVRDMLNLPPAADQGVDDTSEETIPQDDSEAGASRYRRLLAALRNGEELTPFEWAQLGRHQMRLRRAVTVEGGDPAPLRIAARATSTRPRDQAAFAAADARLQAAKDQFRNDMKGLVEKQHAALLKKLRPIIDDFRAADDLTKGTHIKRMQQIEIPMVPAYGNLIRRWLSDFYTTARDEAAGAAGIDPPATISNALRSWMSTKADVISQKHAEALRAAVLLQMLESLRRELPTKQLSWNLTQIARQRASLDITNDLVVAGRELTDLINEALAEIEIPDPEAVAK